MGFSYDKVQSVRQNFQQAIYYYQKACDLKDGMGCSNVGVKYYNGQGVKQNINTEKPEIFVIKKVVITTEN